MPKIQNRLALEDKPIMAASVFTRDARNVASMIDGDINNITENSFEKISLLASRAFIATKLLGKRNNALCPEQASKLLAVKKEARERIGG